MTITYEEVRDKVRNLEFEEGFTVFECGGLNHFVLFCPEDAQDSPGTYDFSEEWVDGAEISIWDSLRREFRKPVLLHEVAEFLLREPYTRNDGGLVYKISEDKAHTIARKFDRRYARETLGNPTFREYLSFCNRFDY